MPTNDELLTMATAFGPGCRRHLIDLLGKSGIRRRARVVVDADNAPLSRRIAARMVNDLVGDDEQRSDTAAKWVAYYMVQPHGDNDV